MSNNLNECDDTFWNGSILGYWLKYTHTRALEEVGLTEAQAQEMYRYLAIANYEDRFVVPSSHRELAREAFPEKNGCGFTFGDGCHGSDTKFNLFNSRRIDAIDVTSKTEPHP